MSSRPITSLFLGGVATGMAILFVVSLVFDQQRRVDSPADQVPSLEAEAAPSTDLPSAGLARSPSERLRPDLEGGHGTEGVLITEALREYARQGLRKGWASVRSDDMPEELVVSLLATYEEEILALPGLLGRWRAEDQTERDLAAARSELEALLFDAYEQKLTMLELVEDPAEFGALFAPEVSGPQIAGDVAGREPGPDLPDGTTLVYPPGVYRVEMRALSLADRFPADLTLAGAGRDATLLIVGDIGSRGTIERFTIRDCTVFTDDDYLFQQRGGDALIQLFRTRVVGFDMGAGSSCMFSGDNLALYAQDSEFLGGYGRSPASGSLLRHDSSGRLMRFDRCRLARIEVEPRKVHGGMTLVFAGCVLQDLLDSRTSFESAGDGVSFPGTTISFWDETHPGEDLPELDLDELFPGWKDA
jgi:hypothetical protein